MKVKSVEKLGFTGEPVYDLTVDKTHTYIVSKSDVVVHNSGVSSDYSSRVRPVNWDLMPNIRLVIDAGSDNSGDVSKGAHPDFNSARNEFLGAFETLQEAKHKYPSESEWIRWFTVKDSREGWAECVAILETATYHEKHKDKLFIFDFSEVRCEGSPIKGQQNRPASGPVPLMRSLQKVASVKGSFMVPWKQAMFVDDYMSSCITMGGVRRIARMAYKWWEDRDIFDFIEIKRGGHLRMANNSILVDKKFWDHCKDPRTHAYRVFQAACAAAYYDNTGEPGFINVDNMRQNREGIDQVTIDNYLNFKDCGMEIHHRTLDLAEKVLNAIKKGPYICAPNPCVTGDTLILTNKGYRRIDKLVGKQVKIWNGDVWSTVVPKVTGHNQKVMTLSFSDGSSLTVTPYHKFIVNGEKLEAGKLQVGDKLSKWSFPLIKGNLSLNKKYAYTQGFYSGDGDECTTNGFKLRLYDEKIDLLSHLEYISTSDITETNDNNLFVRLSLPNMKPREWVPSCKYTIKSRLAWLAGILDSDGTINDATSGAIGITSINQDFLVKIQRMLHTLGISSTLALSSEAGQKLLPDNKGYGDSKYYDCQNCWLISISGFSVKKLRGLGLKTYRLQLSGNPNRDAGRFVQVVTIGEEKEVEKVYCFNEPINHTGIFNGILTGQCGEACLSVYGDDCIVGDIGLHSGKTINDIKSAAKLLAKCLVRVSGLMRAIYCGEKIRTNRIGVSGIGILEFFWNHFNVTFYDLISVHDYLILGKPNNEIDNYKFDRIVTAWETLREISFAAETAAREESVKHNLNVPDTITLLKPGGTIAKVLCATESANLPARTCDIRYIQYSKYVMHDGNNILNPIVEKYRLRGYPVKDISHKYSGYVIVGFPRIQPYIKMMKESSVPDTEIATANTISMEQHYKWLRLLEKYWLGESDYDGSPRNAQIAYTLKYNPKHVSFDEFMGTVIKNQPTVRVCSFNTCVDNDSTIEEAKKLTETYGWVPEYPITYEEYVSLTEKIVQAEHEEYNDSLQGCENGVCSIDSNIN